MYTVLQSYLSWLSSICVDVSFNVWIHVQFSIAEVFRQIVDKQTVALFRETIGSMLEKKTVTMEKYSVQGITLIKLQIHSP